MTVFNNTESAKFYIDICTELMNQLDIKLTPFMASGKILRYDSYAPLSFSTGNYKQCLQIAEGIISKAANVSSGDFNGFKRVDMKSIQGPSTAPTIALSFVADIIWAECELDISCIVLYRKGSDLFSVSFEPIFEENHHV